MISINTFYTDVLGADLRNSRWSWGSFDPVTNRVYLRVWEDQLRSIGGEEFILVLRSSPRRQSPGYAERQGHLELIRQGAEAFGIVCTARDPATDGAREIRAFESQVLLQLGEIVDRPEGQYARVAERVPTTELRRPQTSSTTLASDLRSILRKALDATEKDALVSARIGQGAFRTKVLRLWGGRCAVTGATTLDVIRASHIKPWKDSSDDERLDPFNGLPLVANFDALFDAGLITFGPAGNLFVSGRLSVSDRRILGVDNRELSTPAPARTADYLAYHREKIYRDA
jgi:putative restriction endonuclease